MLDGYIAEAVLFMAYAQAWRRKGCYAAVDNADADPIRTRYQLVLADDGLHVAGSGHLFLTT